MSNRKGQTLLEVVAATALVALVVTALVGLAVAAVRSANASKNRALATSYAQEGLEALRSIRDQSFTNLIACKDGAHRLTRTDSQWGCTPGEEYPLPSPNGIFRRSFTLAETEPDPNKLSRLLVTMTVTWIEQAGTPDVTLQSYLTNWR